MDFVGIYLMQYQLIPYFGKRKSVLRLVISRDIYFACCTRQNYEENYIELPYYMRLQMLPDLLNTGYFQQTCFKGPLSANRRSFWTMSPQADIFVRKRPIDLCLSSFFQNPCKISFKMVVLTLYLTFHFKSGKIIYFKQLYHIW